METGQRPLPAEREGHPIESPSAYRLAIPADATRLAVIHWKSSRIQAGGFMFQLGTPFLRAYYGIMLREKHSVVLCALTTTGEIVGFNSGTMRAEEHARNLHRHRMRLGIAAVVGILKTPGLLRECWRRATSLRENSSVGRYGIKVGPRGEYWAWDPDAPDPVRALECNKKWHLLMSVLGARCVRSEIDTANKRVLKAALLRGARIVHKFSTPDGRERCVMEEDTPKI